MREIDCVFDHEWKDGGRVDVREDCCFALELASVEGEEW